MTLILYIYFFPSPFQKSFSKSVLVDDVVARMFFPSQRTKRSISRNASLRSQPKQPPPPPDSCPEADPLPLQKRPRHGQFHCIDQFIIKPHCQTHSLDYSREVMKGSFFLFFLLWNFCLGGRDKQEEKLILKEHPHRNTNQKGYIKRRSRKLI